MLYEDVNDPRGVGLLTFSEDPDFFLDRVRPLLNGPGVLGAHAEAGIHDARPHLCDRLRAGSDRDPAASAAPDGAEPGWKWAVWYPLRRSGKFAQLPVEEQRVILAEHGAIGMSFGAGDYAHDIRLACHGLDKDDNDFVVGLIGKDLYPLSAIVQTMRKTQQTSLYLERLGPFFVGRVVWQSAD